MSHSHGHGNCDGHSHSHGSGGGGSDSSASSSSQPANPPPRRGQTRRQEQMMSFGWFIGLHFPILYALLTGNTTLHYSIWPDAIIPSSGADPTAAAEAPADTHPPSRGIGYAIVFFIWLTLTWIMYFTAALSYPGFVDTEYQRRKNEPATDEPSQKKSRNGYARVNEEEEMKHGVDEVRLDVLSPRIDRIAVDDEVNIAVAPSTAALSPKGPGAIPASLVGEAAEAADLSVGCAPPVALPLLKTLGLSRDQIHAADQTAEDDERAFDIAAEESESTRLTASSANSSSSSASIQMSSINRSAPTASSSSVSAVVAANGPPAPTEPLGSMVVSRSVEYSPPNAYCSMCRLVKPDRSKHCYKCRHCVQKFDHHCPFVANCIGAHNHRYFLIYLWLQMTTMMWGLVLNVEPYYYNYTPKEFYGHASVMCIMIMQLMVSGMLCMFHTWLAITNQTTYQVIKMQDAAATLTPDSLARRQTARRTRNRVNGDSSDEDEEDFTPGSAASKLKWNTYHVGFFKNMFTFCLGRLPDEHALPRSIVDGRAWVHLPHQFETVERMRKDGTVVRATADEMWAMKVRSLEEDSNNPGPIHESTVVHLSMNGVQLPTNAAELAAFPDTPPMEPIEAYTRPIRIIGKSKVGINRDSSSSAATSSSPRKIEPDTDDEEVETSSVRL